MGAFWVQVGSYVCSTRWSNYCLKWLQLLLRHRPLVSGIMEACRLVSTLANHAGAPDLRAKNGQGWAAVRRGSWCFATGPVVTKCFMWTLKCFFCFCFFPKTSVQYFTKRQKWSLFLANPHITVPFCQTGGWVRGKVTARIPSSSLTEVWSAQTWTLGTLFTHVIVTCKPPCRKHKIHLYIFNLQAMTAQTDQGERKRKRKKKREKSRFEEGPYSQRQKC